VCIRGFLPHGSVSGSLGINAWLPEIFTTMANGRLSYLTLAVADVPAAANFYREIFGWKPGKRSPTLTFIELPGLTVALMAHPSLSEFTNYAFKPASTSNCMHSWNVDSETLLNEIVAKAGALGATIEKAVHELPWGAQAAIIRTPDGHLWEIVWNPNST